MKNPFTDEENSIMMHLVNAHNLFEKIDRTHPSEMKDWVDGIHKLQGLLMERVTRRDYPEYFKHL